MTFHAGSQNHQYKITVAIETALFATQWKVILFLNFILFGRVNVHQNFSGTLECSRKLVCLVAQLTFFEFLNKLAVYNVAAF